ncbi:MAG: hypothetical protein G01um101493_153, partial [Microgenomates group bacterium Gr01-1014_93]
MDEGRLEYSGIALETKPKEVLKEPLADALDNEFIIDPDLEILQPLPITDDHYSQIDKEIIKKNLEKEFEYLSRTRQLEVSSERIAILQGIINKMVEDTDIKPRLVVMNKGECVEGAVYPDGTIIISQSLLNHLDTIEEVAGVLGHEIGHLINKTHIRVNQESAGSLRQFGVEWIHEAAADLQAPRLLEKAGLNSLAYGSAIDKIAGIERGMEHQSGLSRSSMVTGAHFFIDSRTSHLPQHPLYEDFQRNFRRTNLEIATDQILKCDLEAVRKFLEPLYPRDLEKIYGILWEKRTWGYDSKNRERLKTFNQLILERAKNAGYPEIETILMLISHPVLSHHQVIEDTTFIDSHEKLSLVVDKLKEFENSDQRKLLHKEIFGTLLDISRSSPSSIVLKMIVEFMYNSNITPDKAGIPFTNQSILETLEVFSSIRFTGSNPDTKPNLIAAALAKYIEIAYVQPGAEEEALDYQAIRDFLIEVKNRRITFDQSKFISSFYIKPAKRAKEDHHGKNQAILNVFSEVFNIDISEGFNFEEIDEFFLRIEQGETNFEAFILKIQKHFSDNEIEDSDRLKYMDYINEKIDRLSLTYTQPLLEILKQGKNFQPNYNSGLKDRLSENDEQINNAIVKFRLKVLMAETVFSTDGDEFYKYIKEALEEIETKLSQFGQTPESLSKVQMINLLNGLFNKAGFWGQELWWVGNSPNEIRTSNMNIVKINDLDRLFKLPFIRDLAQKHETFDCKTIKELTEVAQKYVKNILFGYLQNGTYGLYQDEALSLVIGPDITKNFESLLNLEIPETEFDSVLNFLDNFFPNGPQKQEIVSALRKKFLESKEVPLDQKITYLQYNLESVGYEGVLTVVGQIEDINTYREFRKRMGKKLETYLSGNPTISILAASDVTSSKLVQDFEKLLATAQIDPRSIKSVSQSLSKAWLEAVFNRHTDQGINYDENQKKFILNQGARATFKTVSDAFKELKNLSQIQRFAISHKALMEKGGALSNPENREKLANAMTSALGLREGFIVLVLKTAIKEGDGKYIGFPASNMLASLLFRALDLSLLDMQELANLRIWKGEHKKLGDILTEAELSKIL